MIGRFVLGLALVAALVLPVAVEAHEGHVRKLTGTLVLRDGNRLDVKTTDGKTSTTMLNEKTKILRGKGKVTAEQITVGERAIVTTIETKGKDGKLTFVVTEIRLAAGPPASK